MAKLSTAYAAGWMHHIARHDCTERTIRRWVENGRIPNHGTPRRIIVDTDDILDMLDRVAT